MKNSPEKTRERLARRREIIGRSHSADWNKANPEKRRAHKTVENKIISDPSFRKPCERCGTTLRVQAHHEDYSRPLDVMWLCPPHHKERHREMRAIAA